MTVDVDGVPGDLTQGDVAPVRGGAQQLERRLGRDPVDRRQGPLGAFDRAPAA
ncbi:hypothetical protein UQW22_14955 [Isoptericola halotolerans]